MRISDWSSDVCSSDLAKTLRLPRRPAIMPTAPPASERQPMFIAMNRFKVKHGQEAAFEAVWKNRDTHLRGVPGFKAFSRSEARRVGKECVSTCRSRRSPDH